jgi:hypothetical protein
MAAAAALGVGESTLCTHTSLRPSTLCAHAPLMGAHTVFLFCAYTMAGLRTASDDGGQAAAAVGLAAGVAQIDLAGIADGRWCWCLGGWHVRLGSQLRCMAWAPTRTLCRRRRPLRLSVICDARHVQAPVRHWTDGLPFPPALWVSVPAHKNAVCARVWAVVCGSVGLRP